MSSQVWSVSANIAAYASEGAKQVQRAPRKLEIEKAAKELQRISYPDINSQIMMAVAATAASVSLLTSDRKNPQATLEEALEAYEENLASTK